MIEFGLRVRDGLCAAGWVLGLIAGLGVIGLVLGLFGYALMCVFGGEDKMEEEDE